MDTNNNPKLVFKFRRETGGQESRNIVLGHLKKEIDRLPPPETTLSSPSSGVKEEEKEDPTSILPVFKKRKTSTFKEQTININWISPHYHDHDHTLPPTMFSNKKERKKISPRLRSRDFVRPEPEYLPITLQNWIQEKGGQHLRFIHQKYLKSSDVCKKNNRLSVPVNQVWSPEFLSEEEKEKVKERDSKGGIKGMQVKVVDRDLREYQLCLKQWDMAGTSVYNLITRWNQVVRDDNLEEKDNLQLWSFRLQSQLCFALVKLPSTELRLTLG